MSNKILTFVFWIFYQNIHARVEVECGAEVVEVQGDEEEVVRLTEVVEVPGVEEEVVRLAEDLAMMFPDTPLPYIRCR